MAASMNLQAQQAAALVSRPQTSIETMQLSQPFDKTGVWTQKRYNVTFVCTDHENYTAETLKTVLQHSIRNISSRMVTPIAQGSFGFIFAAATYFPTTPYSRPVKTPLPFTFVVKSNRNAKHARIMEHEAAQMLKLQHENVLSCPCYAFTSFHAFLLLPRAKEDLEDRLISVDSNKHPMRWLDRFHICNQVGTGISYLHGKNIVHADMTPNNILLFNRDHIRISDFGRCQKAGAANPWVRLTPYKHYRPHGNVYVDSIIQYGDMRLAPELYCGLEFETKSDVYGWGLILINMLQGKCIGHTWTNSPSCRFMDNDCPDPCKHFLEYDDGTHPLRSFTNEEELMKIDHKLLYETSIREQLHDFLKLAKDCLSLDATKRPDIVTALQQANTIAASCQPLSTEKPGKLSSQDGSAGSSQMPSGASS